MHQFHKVGGILIYNIFCNQRVRNIAITVERFEVVNKTICKSLHTFTCLQQQQNVPKPLRNTKHKSQVQRFQNFVDIKKIRTVGGKGGDGEISFLQLWVNDKAGPDGGDGGNGGHVIFEVAPDVKDLGHIDSLQKANDGERGYNKDCFGKNAEHAVVKVPVGTIIRDMEGKILADLDKVGMMFIAARGGAGGHGNSFFKSNQQQTPKISEYGAQGEDIQYVLEVRSMAHIGLIGLPNAGKSTLLRAISRARPKVASYPFTTLKPHIGTVLYDDYEQIAVADLPGLISESHKNRGLGITFLKHAERCAALLFILDISLDDPFEDFDMLRFEISQFSRKLYSRPHIVVANKIDLPNAKENLERLKSQIDVPIIPISAKMGTNISTLLTKMRILYDDMNKKEEDVAKD